eukprot:2298272-Alexandrium_andersonii.AAC.1
MGGLPRRRSARGFRPNSGGGNGARSARGVRAGRAAGVTCRLRLLCGLLELSAVLGELGLLRRLGRFRR